MCHARIVPVRFNVFSYAVINMDTLSLNSDLIFSPILWKFLPQMWKFLLPGHFSGITLILLLSWTSNTQIQLTITKSRRVLTLIDAFLHLGCKRHGTGKNFQLILKFLSRLASMHVHFYRHISRGRRKCRIICLSVY